MSLILFYDTETSSLPLWSQPSSDPGQPHIVQAAAKLIDSEKRTILASFELMTAPGDWEIAPEALGTHGITKELAATAGFPEIGIIKILDHLSTLANFRVAYNEPFDSRIMRIGIKRFFNDEAAEAWKARPAECAMKMARPICKCPRLDGKNGHKNPKLEEAYQFFTRQPMIEAHRAMADTNALIRVYFAIKDREIT